VPGCRQIFIHGLAMSFEGRWRQSLGASSQSTEFIMRSLILFCLASFVVGCNNSIPTDTHPEETTSGLLLDGEGTSSEESGPEGSGSTESEIEESDSEDERSADEYSDTGTPSGDSSVPPVDADEDGWFSYEDCDDNDERIHPGAPEFCDGIDTDCDGRNDPPDAVDAQIWFRDADNDGFGTPLDTIPSCDHPGSSWVENDLDCDDMDRDVHPEAEEVCDGIDNDCDGVVDPDDSLDAVEWFFDADGDGHGGAAESYMGCSSSGVEWVSGSGDCDDMIPEVHPEAIEYCDGIDSDCSGSEATEIATFFPATGDPLDVTAELTESTFYASEVGRLSLCEGDWSGRILIDTGITTGTTSTFTVEGIGDVVLDANGEGSVIEVLGGIEALHVLNMEITGGDAERGGGISAAAVELELEDVALTLNTAVEIGGAIYVNEGNVVMRRVEIVENLSEGIFFGGGGVYVGIGNVFMESSSMNSNHAEGMYSSGGAVFILMGEVSMTNSAIESNTAVLAGGGVNIGYGSLKMVGSIFEENEAINGGGAYVGGDVFMSDSVFLKNRSTAQGGGLFLNNSSGWNSLECQSLESGSHGFLRNEAGSTGSAVHVGNSEFSAVFSDECDWGMGTTDNLDEDLRLGPFDGEAGTNASFVCEGTDCSGEIGMIVSP
jgi:hypothetical protein